MPTCDIILGAVPSIKYVTLFLANFDLPRSPLSHFVTPPGLPPRKYVTHLGPPNFSKPSKKFPDKSPLYKFYLNCSRRFCPEGFVRVGFCPFPLRSQYICYFMFHMYDKNLYKRDVTCSLPPPPVTNCHTFSDPFPSSVTYFMDGPLVM